MRGRTIELIGDNTMKSINLVNALALVLSFSPMSRAEEASKPAGPAVEAKSDKKCDCDQSECDGAKCKKKKKNKMKCKDCDMKEHEQKH
jgi:hypothetical protein